MTDRLQVGIAWEIDLANWLKKQGWLVAPFGMATLPGAVPLSTPGAKPGDVYKALLRWQDPGTGRPCGLRFLPDMIATRGRHLWTIDAKTELAPSHNYAIEERTVAVGHILAVQMATPVLYVWSDGGCLTPDAIRHSPVRYMSGVGSRGSQTPFLLVPKKFALPTAEVLGKQVP